jgi:hypothetical protein
VIALAFRILLALGAMFGALAVTGLAEPPRILTSSTGTVR